MLALYHEQIPTSPGIYRIVCTADDKIYIGSAVNLQVRRKNHFGTLQRNIHKNPKLQRAWNKYGEQFFAFEIIELILVPDVLIVREQYWFDKLKPFGHRGFNIARVAGSTLGKKHSPETRAKMSAALRGKGHPNHLIGVKRSPETCAKMSAARKGKPSPNRGKTPSTETRAKLSAAGKLQFHDPEIYASKMKTLIAISPDGTEYIVVGVRRFCREHNLIHSKLMQVAQGKYSQHHGWKARFPDEISLN